MIEARNYQSGDVRKLKPRDIYGAEADIFDRTDFLGTSTNSVAYTLVDSKTSEVIAIVGMTMLWQGVADLWAVTSDLVDQYPLAFVRKCRKLLKVFFTHAGIHRWNTYVRCDFVKGHKFTKSLGFEFECKLRKFGPDGSDFYFFSRVA